MRQEATNAWIVGVCIVAATLRVPIVSGPRARRADQGRAGGVAACRALEEMGFAGSAAAWNAWTVGARMPLALAEHPESGLSTS